MSAWLEDYVYAIKLQSWIFLVAIGSSFVVAMIAVGYRSLRAATANPVNSLRSE
ncbi:MAG: hypothetical protein WDO15_24430 [Bacteroidota bacterium]